MPNDIFVFTLTAKQDCFEKGDCVFSADGDTVGRVLHRLRVAVDPEDIFYSYDILCYGFICFGVCKSRCCCHGGYLICII